MTKYELKLLYCINREIELQKKRLQELETLSEGTTQQITGMPFADGISDKIGNYAAEIADLKSLIELNIQKCWYELNRLNRYIDGIEDYSMRLILRLRHVNGLTWKQIGDELGYDRTTVAKKYEKFLKDN